MVVPGCADFFNQGAPDTVPERYRGRKSYYHNPVATLVRLEPDEMAALGRVIAERLNEARGPVEVLVPTRGSRSPTWRAATCGTRRPTRRSSRRSPPPCAPRSRLETADTHVNDPAFASLVSERYLALVAASTPRA